MAIATSTLACSGCTMVRGSAICHTSQPALPSFTLDMFHAHAAVTPSGSVQKAREVGAIVVGATVVGAPVVGETVGAVGATVVGDTVGVHV